MRVSGKALSFGYGASHALVSLSLDLFVSRAFLPLSSRRYRRSDNMTQPATIPPDRGHVQTERRHEESADLDALDTHSLISLFANDHRAVVDAALYARDSLKAFIDALVVRMHPPTTGRLIYIGAGTSGRLGVLDASECPPTFQSDPAQVVGIIAGGDACLRKSSESMEDDPNGAAAALEEVKLTDRDSVLGIAAGGTTAYVLGALSLARQRGAMTALLTCAANSASKDGAAEVQKSQQFDHLIYLPTGPEVLTGSTRLKAGSATKLALNIISTVLFVRLGKVYSNLMVDLRATNAKLRDRAIRIILELCTELNRQDAAQLLDRADGHVKRAIIMQRLDVDSASACAILDSCDGSLRASLESRK